MCGAENMLPYVAKFKFQLFHRYLSSIKSHHLTSLHLQMPQVCCHQGNSDSPRNLLCYSQYSRYACQPINLCVDSFTYMGSWRKDEPAKVIGDMRVLSKISKEPF
jgi:hypothetical protein